MKKNNGHWLAALALAAAMPVAADDWTAWTHHDRLTDEVKVLGVFTATYPEDPLPKDSGYVSTQGLLSLFCDSRLSVFTMRDSHGVDIEKFMPSGKFLEIRSRFDNETVQELSAFTDGTVIGFYPEYDMLSLAEGRRRLRIEVPSIKGDLYFDFGLTGLHEAYRETCG